MKYPNTQWRRPGAEFGRTEIFFADQEWRFLEKMSIFTAKISDDLFFSYRPGFSDFPFFSQIFRIFTMLDVVYDPFLTRKTTISEKKFLYDTFF